MFKYIHILVFNKTNKEKSPTPGKLCESKSQVLLGPLFVIPAADLRHTTWHIVCEPESERRRGREHT